MKTRTILTVIGVLFHFSQASLVSEAATPATTIDLEQPIHFSAANGDDIVAQGRYSLEVTEEWLRLTPAEARDALLLQARRSSHEETVEEPVALIIQSEQDRIHLVLLLPGGESLTAFGTYSGIRSRAPVQFSLNRTTINKALVLKQRTLSASKPSTQPFSPPSSSAQVQEAGAPPHPVLLAPDAGQSFAEPAGITFSWRPGPQNPSGVSYEVLAWKAGLTPSQETANRREALSLGKISLQTIHTNSLPDRTLPDDFLGKKVNWTVKACAPNTSIPTFSFSGNPPLACSESQPRNITIQFPAPRIQTSADGKVNQRLNPKGNAGLLRAEGYSSRTQYLLFCVSKPGNPCGTLPTAHNHPTTVVERRSPRFPSMTFLSEQNLQQFVGQTVHWTVASCHPAVGCVWAQPQSLTIFPDPPRPTLLGPTHFLWKESPIHNFSWSVPSDPTSHVHDYKFCLWQQQVPSERPPGRCLVEHVTRNTSFRMDVRSYGIPGWGKGQFAWTVEACNEGACSDTPLEAIKYVHLAGFPEKPVLENTPDYVVRQDSTLTLNWHNNRDSHTDYFVPCLRPASQPCESHNEILDARVRKPPGSQNFSETLHHCTIEGTYPEGTTMVKNWQVAACNEVWGCVWSAPAYVTFAIPSSKKNRPIQPLTCRHSISP